jgi:sulfide:quinone oxidoreductase
MTRHDVVVVGGGNAGISVAGRLRRLGCRDVVIVAPSPIHQYRPLLNYVAGGQASMSRLTRPMRSVIPDGCAWLAQRAVAVDPDERQVTIDDGKRVGYQDLVLAPGLEPDLGAIAGLAEALEEGWSTTAYLSSSAEATWEAIRGMTRGRAVFTIPPEPAPCAGTALKPLFLACDHWRKEEVLPDIDVHLVTPYASLLDLPFVDRQLQPHIERFGITVHHGATVASLNHETRSVALKTQDGEHVLDEVDRAFVVPHYRAPDWLAPFAGEETGGLVDIEPTTLAHRRHRRIWSLGDVANVQTRPSGGALRRQVEILAENIRRSRAGESPRHYDGYTIIPITVDRQRLLLAEFDRTGAPQPSVRLFDLTVPRRVLRAFDRYLEPVIYYRALLKGRV